MSISELYNTNEHRNNLAHFAAIINLALVDGAITPEEENKVKIFAYKLGVSDDEHQQIVGNLVKYPFIPPNTPQERLEHIYDFFKIIYSDHFIDEPELSLLKRYAVSLGYTSEKAAVVIQKSIKLFGGDIDFEDFEDFIKKK